MTTAQPQLDDLIGQIKARLAEGPFSEFDFRRFEVAADKLKKAAPEMSFSAHGILACIRNNETRCRMFHDKSIKIAPLSSLMYHNYGVSLLRLGYLREAATLARKSIDLDGLDKRPAGLLLETTYRMGDAEMLSWALTHWRRVCCGERHVVEDYLLEDAGDAEIVDKAIADMNTHGTIPWKEFRKEITV